MAIGSLGQMFEEIAAGLKAGDEEIYGWLREQLKECGGSEISIEFRYGRHRQLAAGGGSDGRARIVPAGTPLGALAKANPA